MKTLLKYGSIGVIILLVAVYFIGSSLLNKAVKIGVETVAPEILGVSVTLEEVKLSPFSGSGLIRGLTVGNPEGFKSEKAFSFKEVFVDVSITSLMSGLIHAENIRIEDPEFVYEKKLKGSNISALMKNLEGEKSETKEGKGEPGAEEKTEASEPIKIKVDHFSISGGMVKVVAFGATIPVPMPPVTLEGIGKDGGVPADEAISAVLKAVLSSVTGAVTNTGGKVLDIGGDAGKGAVDAAKGVFKGVKGLFDKK